MTKNQFVATTIAVLILIGIFMYVGIRNQNSSVSPTPAPSPTTSSNTAESVSDSIIQISYDSSEFGLATNASQMPANSYIPACDPDFEYCFYHIGDAYKGTNFESAGIRVAKLGYTSESQCLGTPPSGFDSSKAPSGTKNGDVYASSEFSNIGDAAAGHYASGDEYRLFLRSNSSCYQFDTRIGETQYANYPAGSIKKFTDSDRSNLNSKLRSIINNISLPKGEANLFPNLAS
ncbi:MAG: hypothetical protein V4438_01510 [Patescibacteria group bacterium]